MDVDKAVHDYSEIYENLDLEQLDPRNLSLQDARFSSWFFAYLLIKMVFRYIYGGKIWDETSLIHNFLSVVIGLYDIYFWDIPEESTCLSIHARPSLVVNLQLLHCITDLVFIKEMFEEPVFIWHHLFLGISAMILPYCPGCYFVVIAYTMAEFGSMSIAVDAWWRQAGGFSRGLKRVVIFGLSRVLNLYLLYRLYLITPATTYFTLSSEEKKVFTVNFPICMITSVGCSVMLLCVNGVTWYRMYKVYVVQKKKRKKKNKKKKNQ